MKKQIQIKQEGKSMFFWRAVITILFFAFLVFQSSQSSKIDHLKPHECIWDWVFVKTDSLNRHFLANLEDRNIMMAITAYLMDFVTIYFVLTWYWSDLKTTRPYITVLIFYITRGYI